VYVLGTSGRSHTALHSLKAPIRCSAGTFMGTFVLTHLVISFREIVALNSFTPSAKIKTQQRLLSKAGFCEATSFTSPASTREFSLAEPQILRHISKLSATKSWRSTLSRLSLQLSPFLDRLPQQPSQDGSHFSMYIPQIFTSLSK